MNTEDTPLCGSWPRLGTAKGQYQTIKEPAPACGSTSCPFPRTSESASEPCKKRNFAAVLSRATCSSDDDYEDPELQLAEARTAMRILPARPLKESEYADTRHLKAVMDAPLPLSPDKQRQSLQRTREERKPSSQDIRSPHLTGDRPTKGNKIPFPPPRPPLTLPKQYQPLPPEPPEIPVSPLDCYTPCHILPEAPRGPRQISLKDLSKVLGVDKVSHHPTRLEASYPSQSNLRTEAAVASSSFMPKSLNMQDRGSMHSCSQQRCQSPASYGPRENVPLHKNTNQSKPVPAPLREKELLHKEWYIGECSRQAVEEALMKESKDGTFLVRDCSTKSKAEPYVLVIFHGNKVYNVKIRFLEKGQQFALGTGLRGDEKFDSVEDIIEHYKYSPIMLIDGKDKTGVHREECYLTQPLRLTRHLSPW